MHSFDTLVLGPFPLIDRSVRLPLRATAAAVLAMLLLGGVALVIQGAPVAAPLRSIMLTGTQPVPPVASAGPLTRIASTPSGADILLDGRLVGRTPADVDVSGHAVGLRRAGAADVSVLDPSTDLVAAILARPVELAVRPPVPGGAITDVAMLADGRLALSVASLAGPGERTAWIFDPVHATIERVGPAIREAEAPAGVVVGPDGAHRALLIRGAMATALAPARPDTLLLDGPEGRRLLLGDGVLAPEERVRDLAWSPDGRWALLVTQRPIAGDRSTGRSLVRLRQVPLTGPARDLIDLPVAPVEGSWVWSPDGHSVAFLVATAPPTLATLDFETAGLRSVADMLAESVPSAGAVAPAAWLPDGTLVFATAHRPVAATPAPTLGAVPPSAQLEALAPGRVDPHPLEANVMLATAPSAAPDGRSLVALTRAADGTLLLRTLSPGGRPMTEQSLDLRAGGALAVRWDLVHGQLVLLQAAASGGIDVRVVRLDGAGS